MKAIWGMDYDYQEDKCYQRPSCPECEEPIWKYEDGWYHCFNCGKVVEVDNPEMVNWFKLREETKIKHEDCRQIKSKDGKVLSGCGGKKCMRITYRRNPVTLKWGAAYGICEKCGTRFIV